MRKKFNLFGEWIGLEHVEYTYLTQKLFAIFFFFSFGSDAIWGGHGAKPTVNNCSGMIIRSVLQFFSKTFIEVVKERSYVSNKCM